MPHALLHRRLLRCLAALLVAGAIPLSAADERDAYFESKIRPLLHLRCGECHGERKQQGDVRVDLRSAVLGAAGAPGLVVPGKPDDSRIIQVIRYSGDDVQMPPKGKLAAEEIERLTEWVRAGAHWPADESAAASGGLPRGPGGALDFAAAREAHWAFQPLRQPDLPAGGHEAPTGIDAFINARLQREGVPAAPPADRSVLIRRAMLDLWGIPPTYDQVQEFVRDDSADAWPRLVERLLASPLYGQRWGRHWLDVARYADTKGYVFTENPKYPFAYTYRDYVVQAFNDDKPFDRFVVEQLAADQLNLPAADPNLAALGFVTVGPRYLNREPDIIDDRIDLVTRGLMGLTVACARCHDHKYDPVPTADYYSLYGVFASSQEPAALPGIGAPDDGPGARAFQAELDKREQAVQAYLQKLHTEFMTHLRERCRDYLQAAVVRKKRPGEPAAAFEHGEPREKLVEVWSRFVDGRAKPGDPVFGLWSRLAAIPAENFTERAAEVIRECTENPPPSGVNARVLAALQDAPPNSLMDVARTYGSLLQSVDGEWRAAIQAGGDAPPAALPEAHAEQLRLVLYGPDAPPNIPADQTTRLFDRDHRDEHRKLERKVEEWHVESSDAPPRAMVLSDRDKPVEPVVFLRGDPGRRGDRVPRQPPRILSDGESRPFQQGSGRLELARHIVDPQNPLTARVLVNRVWGWHFGRGLVVTASDFGLRGEPPTHPELLDWLAWTFIHEDHWSLKALHRRIMLSDAYQRSSDSIPESAAKDPENRLLWRTNRQRLDFEPMHDSLLAVAGRLDTAVGGRPVNLEQAPFSHRRAIYGQIDRNNFSPLLRTFDYPSPDATSPGRPVTTVPQQALFALNSPFLRFVAEEVARHSGAAAAKTPDGGPDRPQQVVALYRQVLSRDPDAEEARLAERFLAKQGDDLTVLAQALLLTNEFLFVD